MGVTLQHARVWSAHVQHQQAGDAGATVNEEEEDAETTGIAEIQGVPPK